MEMHDTSEINLLYGKMGLCKQPTLTPDAQDFLGFISKTKITGLIVTFLLYTGNKSPTQNIIF